MLRPTPIFPAVRSVCMQDQTLLLGTQGAQVFEVFLSKIPRPTPGGDRKMQDAKEDDRGDYNVPADILQLYRKAPSDRNRRGSSAKTAAAEALTGLSPLPCSLHVEGHCTGEVWGLAVHPREAKFATCGDDSTVRIWNLASNQPRREARVRLLGYKLRAVDFSPNGKHLACAATTGHVFILLSSEVGRGDRDDAGILQQLSNRPDENIRRALQWVQDVRYSFDGRLLAVGSHDNNIYLWRCTRDAMPASDADVDALAPEAAPPREYEYLCVLRGHSSYITHMDFGLNLDTRRGQSLEADGMLKEAILEAGETFFDGRVRKADGSTRAATFRRRFVEDREVLLQSNCGAYELLFWRCTPNAKFKEGRRGPRDGTRETRPSSVRDALWVSWTCSLGWPVQGIWPPCADGTDVNAVCRNHLYKKIPAVATADDFGKVKLFNYPCPHAGASDKTYRGHSSHVTNVRFSANDEYLLTTGGQDGCVFVWHTDCLEEARELDAAYATGTDEAVTLDLPATDGEDTDEESRLQVEEMSFQAERSGGDGT
eukprot:scaffold770_cov255-Pinguiococcus_pyrenoidosus.AAC.57